MANKPVSMKTLLVIIGVLVLSFLLLMVNRQITLVHTSLETMGKGVAHQVLVTRAWAAGYGGVWINEQIGSYYDQKNGMYLKTPSMMTTEISRLVGDDGDYSFRLASDRPVNPSNRLADAYEEEALIEFSKGEQEYSKLIDGQYRYIIPLAIDENCIACHAIHGYQVGDLRGILSITIPAINNLRQLYLAISLYLVGAIVTFVLASIVSVNWINQQFVNPLTIMHTKANTDFLTGLFNHGYFQETLKNQFMHMSSGKLSLLFFDIDDFKKVNDTYGHDVGDIVLKELAKVLRLSVRDHDVTARYGGEEFAVILPDTDIDTALEVAKRILNKVNSTLIQAREQVIRVTVSIGVSTKTDEMKNQSDLVRQADQALYRSKREGKNRISIGENEV
jgi:diguanylate cyclase (GGDEF)-like protein